MSEIVRLHTRPEEPERFFSPERRSIYLDKDITEGSFVDNGFKIKFEIKFRLHFTTNYSTTGYTQDFDFKNKINGHYDNDNFYDNDDKLKSRQVTCIDAKDVTDSSINRVKGFHLSEVKCEIETSENLIFDPFKRKYIKKNISSFIESLKSKKDLKGFTGLAMRQIGPS